MGSFNVIAASDPQVVQRFIRSLLNDLRAMEMMLEADQFESDIQRIGVEQEVFLVDQFWRPAPIADQVLKIIDDDRYTTELAKFNLEINLDPLELKSGCFTAMEEILHQVITKLGETLSPFKVRVLLAGILPTIRRADLGMENMTPIERYRALFERLRDTRGTSFDYHIQGHDELRSTQEFPTFEFCNTSFQVHYQSSPQDFVNAYNFSKLIAAPTLAAAVNSPLLIGKRLWQETRIALFQQAVDTRNFADHLQEKSSRVFFSRDWLHRSILEIFKDDISRFRVLLCSEGEEDALTTLATGKTPRLQALSVFSGTVYRWNRACYGITDGRPHLRIENRILPSGPTIFDEVANAAFWIGLMTGMPDEYRDLQKKIPFDVARYNFTMAARYGLESRFQWAGGKAYQSRDLILQLLLPIARDGLDKAGLEKSESNRYLDLIEARVKSRQTGAQWQVENFNNLRQTSSVNEVTVALTAAMWQNQQQHVPVHKWKPASLKDAGGGLNRFRFVDQLMSRELITVQEDDPLDLVVNILLWKSIHHLPVEGKTGGVAGVINAKGVLGYHFGASQRPIGSGVASEVMQRKPLTVRPDTTSAEAFRLMRRKKVGCLLVTRERKLVGIVTEYDFAQIAAELLEELEEGND